ncbi:YolD-like family protein [Paenibacillus macerans]|uniref:YolD-like family protein n=1 Tax=Paenibacillus macerans TaxID=44252 RepID=UPI003D310110
MKGKLYGNGLWESSRMMLPEHKEAILRSNRGVQRKARAAFDEQELERISRILDVSLQTGKAIRLRLHGEWQEREVKGTVTRADSAGRRARLQTEAGPEWVTLTDIVWAEAD